MSFLEGKLAAALAKGFNGKLLSGTLRKGSVTGRDANGDPTTSPTDYIVQGFVDGYSAVIRAAAGIPATDSRLVLIADLCGASPAIGDKVQLQDQWWQVRNVAIDPAQATYDCQSFKVPS